MFSSFTRSFGYGRRNDGGLPYPGDATFALSSSFDARDEGNSVTITLTTSSVPNGTSIPYTITGISASDLSAGSINGNFVVTSNSASTIFTFAQDNTGEGEETMVITLDNHPSVSKAVIINDTSVWGPSNLSSDLVAWIDASDTSSHTLGAGSTLSSVTDKAGTYSMVIDGDPSIVNSALNGLRVFEFDGNDSLLSSSYETQVDSGNHWAIGVFRFDSTNSTKDSLWSYETDQSPKRDYAISSGNSSNSWPGELDLDGLSSDRISSSSGNIEAWTSASLTRYQYHIVACFFNKSGNQFGVRVDGSNAFTPVNDYDNSIQTKHELRLMRNRSSQELAGRMAEFFAVASIPGTSGTDLTYLQQAEGYLAHKWGLTGALPVSHPYKTEHP